MKAHLQLLAILIVAGASCHDKTIDNPSGAQPAACKVTVITPADQIPINFHYNSDGKLASIINGSNAIHLSYKGDSIIATELINNGSFYQTRRYKIGSNGFPSGMRTQTVPSGQTWVDYAFQYSGSELRKSVITTSVASFKITTVYHWSNGNLDSTTDGSSTVRYTYFKDKNYQAGDANFLEAMRDNDGIELFRTKNMRKKAEYAHLSGSSYTTEFGYVFGKQGQVTTINEGDQAYELQYQCD